MNNHRRCLPGHRQSTSAELGTARTSRRIFLPLLASLLVFLSSWPGVAWCNLDTKHVLIVHSYHQEFPWTDSIMAGMSEVLHREYPQVDIHVEYLDAKRIAPEQTAHAFKELLRLKYGGMVQPDVILTSDDDAFKAMLRLRQALFPKTPLVFSGINNFKDSMLEGQAGVTGVVEDFDLEGTLEAALALQPATRRLAVISDSTKTGRINLERFHQIRDRFADRFEGIVELVEMSEAELRESLAVLSKDTIILLLSFYRDRNGKTFSIPEMMDLVADASGLPVYVAWDFVMGRKAVGGRVVSGRQQGETAARLAAGILNGASVESLPIVRTSPNLYMFDQVELDRFNIAPASLPKGSVVINTPPAGLGRYLWPILGFGILALAQSLLILALVRALRRNRASRNELLASEERLQAIVDSLGEGILLRDGSERITLCNQTAADLFSFSADTMTGTPVLSRNWHTIHEDGTPFPIEEHPSLLTLRTGQPCSGVIMGVRREGLATRWIKVNTRPLAAGGRSAPEAVIISFSDITDLKQSAESLRASEERYRLLADLTIEGIVLHKSGVAIDVNGAMARMLGFERDELLNRNFLDFVHTEDLPLVRDNMAKDYAPPYIIRFAKKNGDYFFAEIEARNYQLYGETMRVSAVRDISARLEAEEERRHLQAQLIQAQKMEAIGTLAGGIAHDFNNILGAVIGFAEMAREDSPKGSKAIRYLDKVLEASDRARNLVKQILAFSRQENIEPILLDPEIIVREAAALLRPSLPATIAIRVDTVPDIPPVLADPTQLHQIVINLGTNAFHAMEATGGTLRFALTTVDWRQQTPPAFPESRPGLFVCLTVEDTGPGIPAVVRQRIFEPFFTTKEVGRGTGMGLATVHGIVQKCGGFITCESEPGHGATFRVFLPAMAGGSTSPAQREEVDETDRTGKGHILFVDDEQILVEMGGSMLERLGYEVTACTSSLEALTAFQNDPHRFDAVITDQTMPGMTGLDLAQRMLNIRPDLPIILCTGYSKLVDEAQARAWGIKGFAMKPLTKKEVAALLKAVLPGLPGHEPLHTQ